MKNFFPVIAACAFAAMTLMPTTANAQASDFHTVTINVAAINVLDVGSNVIININAANAGLDPAPVLGNSTWSMTTNSVGPMKVTAHTDAAMPTGLTLGASLAPPAGASAPVGYVPLGLADQDVVNNISQVAGQNLALTYQAVATVAVASSSPSFVVTYTLTTQ